MAHPWLEIPLADYEAHMALPSVAQAQLLRTALARTLELARPRSLAVFGVAGGNGLDAAARAGVQRVVALDLNPQYLSLCAQRFAASFAAFEVVTHDLNESPPPIAPVDCIFAGLLLEYVRVDALCGWLPSLLTAGGTFAALLQLPSPGLPEVSASPYTTLQRLDSLFTFVEPGVLDAQLSAHGFSPVTQERHELASGKSFHYAAYRMRRPACP